MRCRQNLEIVLSKCFSTDLEEAHSFLWMQTLFIVLELLFFSIEVSPFYLIYACIVEYTFSLNLFCGFQSKAAKELAENRSKIDALLDWVAGVGSMEQLSGAGLGKRATDTTDGHRGVNQAPEELDKQCEKMKVRRILACPHYAGSSLLPQAGHRNLFASKPVSTSQFMPSLMPQHLWHCWNTLCLDFRSRTLPW